MRGAQRIVRRERGRICVAVRIGRTERIRRRRGRGGQIQDEGRIRGRLRRVLGRRQLDVREATGIEAARCQGRIALEVLALAVDDVAVVIHLEGTSARVLQSAVVADDEEPGAIQAEVQIVLGGGHVALAELLGDGRHAHSVADRDLRHTRLGLGVDVGELRARFLETGGRDVRDVIRRHVEIGGGGVEAREGEIE